MFENNSDLKSACWLFSMKVDRKNDFIKKMTEYGIMTSQVHNRHDQYSCVSDFKCDLPNISALEKELICIPVGWWLEKTDLDYIVNSIKEGW